MMPDATMVKITMKSMRAALVISSQHNPSHNSRMHTKRIRLPVVIVQLIFGLICKDSASRRQCQNFFGLC